MLEQGRLRGPLPRLTAYSIRDPKILAAQLREAEHKGVIFDNGESHVGVRCVAAPVVVRHRGIAAVSVSVFGSSTKPERYAGYVREAARMIAHGIA